MKRAILLACAFVLAAPEARADPPRSALQLYAAGNFVAAADVAQREPNSSSLAFAARALLAACVTTRDPARIEPLIDRAEEAAQAALTLDPESVEARLQYAVALGVRGRRASIPEAMRHRYAGRGRDLIEEALERAPNDPWAHALMGGWHLEVLRRGGRSGAMLYGARLADGIIEFERARALAPHDPLITLQYAMALIELDAEAHEDRARNLFAAAARMRARDALEVRAQAQGARVARALNEGGPEAARRAARSLL